MLSQGYMNVLYQVLTS